MKPPRSIAFLTLCNAGAGALLWSAALFVAVLAEATAGGSLAMPQNSDALAVIWPAGAAWIAVGAAITGFILLSVERATPGVRADKKSIFRNRI
jgi:hypothetical protein